jgi:hypothetical protein
MATPTPNLGLTQFSQTDHITFVDDYNVDMDKIDDAVGSMNTNIGTLSSLKTQDKTSIVNSINEVYDSTDNGWINTRATLTYSSTSGQNFVCSTSIDLTPRVSVGMKIKLTQTTTKYFYVTSITSNSITLYGGATYSVLNATISNVYFSFIESPYGFPIATNGLGTNLIVEQGTSGIWKYTKWNNGDCEIDGIVSVAYDAGTAFGTGGLYFHKTTGTIVYPFTINGAKACICKNDAVLAWHCGTILAIGDFYFYAINATSGVISSASAGSWRVNIRGTWK